MICSRKQLAGLIISLMLFSAKSFSQSVLIEPGRQTLNTLPKQEKILEFQGNGVILQSSSSVSSENPALHSQNMQCGQSNQTLPFESGVLFEPGGNGNYAAGIQFDCRTMIGDFSEQVMGISLNFEELELGTGDTLYGLDGVTADTLFRFANQPSVLSNSDSLFVKTPGVFFIFKSNGDNSVGKGFKVIWRALKSTAQFTNPDNGVTSLITDFQKQSLLFGIPGSDHNFPFSNLSLGSFNSNLDKYTVNLGYFNKVEKQGSAAIGVNNHLSGLNSLALGLRNKVQNTSSTAIAIGSENKINSSFSVVLGRSNLSNHQSSTLIGTSLITQNNGQFIVGASNDTSATYTNKIFEVASGGTSSRSNALTILDNSFVGIGTVNPKTKLHVAGQIRFSDPVNGNLLTITDNHDLISSDNAKTLIHLGESGINGFIDQNSNLLQLENDGNVFLSLYSPRNFQSGIQFMRPDSANEFGTSFRGSIRLSASNNFDFRLGQNSTRMRLTPQGDLQIGMGVSSDGCLKDGNGTVIAGTCASDSRYKKDIVSFDPLLEDFVKLNPVNFNWRVEEFPEKGFGQKQSHGFIAQEVEKIFPELVQTDEQGFKAINYGKLNIMSIQAIKELKEENDLLYAELNELKEMIGQLKIEISAKSK